MGISIIRILGGTLRKLLLLGLASLILLSGCSDIPLRLKRTANKEMITFMAENSNITEANLYLEPLLVDQFQMTEDKWCLTYEIGHLLRFSTTWEKLERDWVRTEVKPFVDNCNWAR